MNDGIQKPVILFDMDGTILDSVPVIGKACNMALSKNNYPVHPIEAYHRMVGRGMVNLITAACPENTPKEAVRKVISDYDGYYLELCHEKGHIFEGLPEVLNHFRAKGIGIAIVTNKPVHQADALKQSTFKNLFDEIWGQSDEYPLKPDPTMAKNLVQKMNGNLIAYVGDSVVDMELGHRLCVPAIGVLWGSGTREDFESNDCYRMASDAGELESILMELIQKP